jgi:hypothetical protein
MPTFRFGGRVLPLHGELTLPIASFHWEDNSGLTSDTTVSIIKSEIEILSETSRGEMVIDQKQIFIRAHDSARAMVDSYSFVTGNGLTVFLSKVILADGKELLIDSNVPELARLVTAFDLDPSRFPELLTMVLSDSTLLMAMHDLISSITLPHSAVVNCFRAVEGIRRLIAPGMSNKKQGWLVMRQALNIDESCMKFLTSQSEGPRHADRTGMTHTGYQETIERSWVVMNRFLEFRKRGNQQLPLTEFPLLT